ncbi:anthranilate synthase component I family protein [Microbacterium sp. APC 3901]|uniref:anthranilate synthase component I family protein n=1 Tax=Microbacterium sp. APC 3901 TaxID=3035192 RepID=UPI0025B58BE6|nr:anthranilate synthase component I family protein [Microbacterium sp. APC 3901]MDN3445786.1 anthranilate synthase component I family protein [Microbacterium sp. APC 3901]
MPEPLSTRVILDRVAPEALFLALEREHSDLFWLDAGADAPEGWSFIGTGVPSSFPGEVRLDAAGGSVGAATDGVPPLRGGWVGWYDYESGARAAGVPAADAAEVPGGAWLRISRLAAFDHATGAVWVAAAEADLDDWEALVTRVAATTMPDDGPALTEAATRRVEARHTPTEYAALIERCRELIRAGIAYQLCLTTRFTVPGVHDGVAVYRRLRSATPAHHGGFIRIGGRSLLSASPEQFLHAGGGVIRTRPIKGTRPRGADAAHDAVLASELAADAKERAENVMIVDLMRNDLSRVCEPGSIRVDALWAVETYPAVHQLVSTVSGTASPGTTAGALFDAAFPAGSMTGAPKLSAMTRLHALEGGPRGIYSGCFGYIGEEGSLDLAMVIRSIVIDGAEAVVGAGGGITWRSMAASEVAEVATKAHAPLAALGAEVPAAWASDILN